MTKHSKNTETSNSTKPVLPAVSLGNKKRKCYNCKFAGKQFKVFNVTHLHCQDEKQYPKEKWESGELTAWDSLQKFSDTCEFHEFKDSVLKYQVTSGFAKCGAFCKTTVKNLKNE